MAAFDFPASPTDGQTYTSNGVTYVWSAADTAWKGQGSQVPLSNKMRVVVYNTAGTIPYVKPANLKALQVEIWSAGGGGGGAAATAAGQYSAGGGGGGGSYGRKLYQASELAASENLIIGAAGVGAIGAGAATAGGNCSFKGLVVRGGGAGSSGIMRTTYASTSRGGFGTVSGADAAIMGSYGEYGLTLYPLTGYSQAGMGGEGAAGGKVYYVGITTTLGGLDGAAGCGGCAAANVGVQAAANGGAGGGAFAVFTEYYAEADEVLALPDLVMKVTVIDGNAAPGADVTGTYVKPAGLKYLQVELWGAGGAGGGVSTATPPTRGAAVGGGGGAYSRKLYKAEDLAASEAYVVARGANTPGASGAAGTASTFKGMTAGGGFGGGIATPTNVNSVLTRVGGGVATGGDANFNGGHGGSAWWLQDSIIMSGNGGASPLGGGTCGRGNAAQGAGADGSPGNAPGGGGAGAATATNASTGGAGAPGRLILTEYFTELPQAAEPLQEITQDWQPLLRFGGAGDGMVFANQVGGVSKIGSQVVANFDFQLSAKGTSVGGARITNLPYPIRAGSNVAFVIGYSTGMTAGANQLAGYVSYGTPSELIITKTIVGGTGTANTSDADFTNTTRIIGSITYRTAA
jgi:hypothetical protein